MQIKEISDPQRRSMICNDILRALPDWFGVEQSIVDYVNQARDRPFYAAFDGSQPVGFLAIKVHNRYTAEVCVMGVLPRYHRQGIGKALMEAAERYCRGNGQEYLSVKTLDGSADYEPYARTRSFYYKMGFVPLEVFPLFWDEENPCLFLVKHLL